MSTQHVGDKRQEYRIGSCEVVYIACEPVGENSQDTILISRSIDLSANGLQVSASRQLQAGTIHQCCVQLENPRRQFFLSCEVKWSRLCDDGDYHSGLVVLESAGTDISEWKQSIAERCEQGSRKSAWL